jgi:bacterioferritin (cytochrome b1)
VKDYFDSGLGDMLDCAEYFEAYLLPQITAGLILELDEVDILLHEPVDRAWVIDFFSMLRAWYDSKMNAHKEWKKLRIVLVHSREVNRETLNQKKPPFNMGREIELREFSDTQGEELAQRHGLSAAIAHEMITLVGGHPQLLRQGLYAIARKQVSLEQLRESGATEAGFYSQHLETMRGRIEEDEVMKRALRQVLAAGEHEVMIDLTSKAKLRSFGLVTYQGNGVRISCELYRQYFLALWT